MPLRSTASHLLIQSKICCFLNVYDYPQDLYIMKNPAYLGVEKPEDPEADPHVPDMNI